MSMKEVVTNINSYISSDPGVLTYLQGPLYTNSALREGAPHWAIRGAAAIALLFKVGAIALALLAVILLSYLGIMMSWGLAFGLPWTLAYFYFIWICPSHQLSMGIRKLKPYRMIWWMATTGVHCILLGLVCTSYISFSEDFLHVERRSLVKPLVFLSLVLGVLLIFEVIVIYAFVLVWLEKARLEQETAAFATSIRNGRRLSSLPPSYSDVVPGDEGDGGGEVDSDKDNISLPPRYEDLFLPSTPTDKLSSLNKTEDKQC